MYNTDIKLSCLTLPGLEPMIYSTDIKLPDPYQGLNPWCTTLTLSYLVWPYQGLNPWSTAPDIKLPCLTLPGLEPMIYSTDIKLPCLTLPGLDPMIYSTDIKLPCLTIPGLEPMIYSTDIMLPDPYQGLNPWSTALTLCYLIPTRAWTHDLQHWHYVTWSLPGLEPMIYSTDIMLPYPYQGLNPWSTALTLCYLVWPYQGLTPWSTALTLSYLVWPYQGLNPWSTALALSYLIPTRAWTHYLQHWH